MRSFKKFGVLIAVLALSAIGAANASAAQFTASATGSLTGAAVAGAEGVQTLTTNGGQVKCTVAETSGTIVKTADTQQHFTVIFKSCTAFGFASVHISPATFQTTSNGQIHILNTITITVTGAGCHLTIHPQTALGTVSFINQQNGHMLFTPHVKNIAYTSGTGLCGAPGNNGTFTGNSTLTRVGGGTISFDP